MSAAAVETSPLFQPLRLPNGQVIANRIAKAAMEEDMADADHRPGAALARLYARWAQGGSGLILTGNVMIDPGAVTGPGAVILDERQPLEPFAAWAAAARANGARAWMQINHPGRQVYAATNAQAVAPSAVPMEMEAFSPFFARPRALTEPEIADVIGRFADAAALAERAGFDGVQIHAAHGYLINQFLSPRTNRREDRWGGTLPNRARLLLDVVRAARARVSPGFALGVKLNSGDFQKGGFEPEDAIAVVRWLNALPVDLLEISGGSYESPAMRGTPKAASARMREAYFIDFARDIVAAAGMPVMVTGGIRRRATAAAALMPEDGRPGVAMVGMAQALAFAPDLPMRWRRGEAEAPIPRIRWTVRALGHLAAMAVAKLQLWRLGDGKPPNADASPLWTLLTQQAWLRSRSRQYRRWLRARSG